MFVSVTRMRTVIWAFVSAQIVVGSISAAAEPAQAPSRQIAAAQPMRFFSLADRLATLRAQGAIPASPTTASLHESDPPAAPTPASLGLRLSSPDADNDTLLGATPFPVPDGNIARKWNAMQARWRQQEPIIERCAAKPCAHPGARRWLEIREGAQGLAPIRQLDFVHRRVNASIRYATDAEIFGVADYWASPMESLMRSGDCEDFAIAKYLMLRSLGFAARDMKVVALREQATGEFHAILAVRHEGRWRMLDNRFPELADEAAYAGSTPLATIDDVGQTMLIKVDGTPPLRLSTL